MKINKNFVFDSEDLSIVESFFDWICENFEDDSDWNFLAYETDINMDRFYEDLDNLLNYMKKRKEK